MQGNLQSPEAATGHVPDGEIQVVVIVFQIDLLIKVNWNLRTAPTNFLVQRHGHSFGMLINNAAVTTQDNCSNSEDNLQLSINGLRRKHTKRQRIVN